jgi:hypothetical protein
MPTLSILWIVMVVILLSRGLSWPLVHPGTCIAVITLDAHTAERVRPSAHAPIRSPLWREAHAST